MSGDKDPRLAMLELYLATAGKVSERRAQSNSWMLSVNSAIVAPYGYLQADKMAGGAAQKSVWLWAIPAAGMIICLAWTALLTSYRKLNRTKFSVLTELEADLPIQLFAREREIYRHDRRRSFSNVERWIPGCFFVLYLAIAAAAIFKG